MIKRARRDLNPRPTGPEPVALSTEPRALIFVFHNIHSTLILLRTEKCSIIR